MDEVQKISIEWQSATKLVGVEFLVAALREKLCLDCLRPAVVLVLGCRFAHVVLFCCYRCFCALLFVIYYLLMLFC